MQKRGGRLVCWTFKLPETALPNAYHMKKKKKRKKKADDVTNDGSDKGNSFKVLYLSLTLALALALAFTLHLLLLLGMF